MQGIVTDATQWPSRSLLVVCGANRAHFIISELLWPETQLLLSR